MDPLNLIPCPVLVTDAMGHILAANTDLLNLVGGSIANWQLRPMSDIFPPASRIFLQTHVWPMLLRQARVREIHLQLCDAKLQRIPVLVNCQQGLFEGVESYFWVFFVALERSRFEAELLQARSDAQRMSANLALAHSELKSLHNQLTQRTVVVETENRELTDLSQTDPLTGMANRRALTIAVARWQAQAETHACASLLLVDVDHFKAVNDQHGHDEGDHVLIDLSRKLQQSMRLSDLAVRYGGEEFVMWLPLADRLGAGYTAQRVHDNVRKVLVAGKPITVSIGIATATNQLGTELLSQLTQHADKAVYQAKAAGRHCTVHFE
jgi:sigma-B regulation protein RsbU (phosphoserine phosphatase)